MTWLLNTGIVIATFFFMEFMAWATHKFVMHGPSWLCIMFGMMHGNDFKLYIGIGILVYGLAYFLVHEVFIHQRLNWFKRSDNRYLRAIRKAHKVHHKNLGKEHAESFGMLVVARKFFKEQQGVSR